MSRGKKKRKSMYINPNIIFLKTRSEACLIVSKWYGSLPTVSYMMREMGTYFTVWVCLLWCVQFFIGLTPAVSHVFNVMSIHASFGGFYITYIFPKVLIVPYCRLYIDGIFLCVLDVMSHHYIMVDAIIFRDRTERPDWWTIPLAYIPSVFYVLLFSPIRRYTLRQRDIVCIIFGGIVLSGVYQYLIFGGR